MLHILFVIIKILGIILAVILGILLLLVCIVLFVPICYKGKAKCGGRLEDIRAHVQVSWLFGLVRAVADIRNKTPDFYIQIAWKRLGVRPESQQETKEQREYEKHKRKKSHEKDGGLTGGSGQKEPEKADQDGREEREENKSHKELQEPEGIPQNDPQNHKGHEEYQVVPKEEPRIPEEACEAVPEIPEKEQEGNKESQKRDGKKPSFIEKIKERLREIASRIRQIPDKFKCTIQKLCGKIEEVSGKKDRLAAFITAPAHVNALGRGKRGLIKLLRHFPPRILEADIRYGFEDPSLTGRVLAACGVFYPFLGGNVQITPDFQEKVLEGNMRIKGRIYMAHLAAFALGLLLSRDVRRTIKDVRNFKL